MRRGWIRDEKAFDGHMHYQDIRHKRAVPSGLMCITQTNDISEKLTSFYGPDVCPTVVRDILELKFATQEFHPNDILP